MLLPLVGNHQTSFYQNTSDTPDTLDTLDTLKLLDSHISDTLDTLETVSLFDSYLPATSDILVVENIVARLFPRSHRTYTERVKEGVVTYVYRIHYANEIFYLRILPEIDASSLLR